MEKEPVQFITKVIKGIQYAVLNPEWEKFRLKKKYDLLLMQSNIPHYYWDIEFDNYQGNKDSKSYQYTVDYAKNLATDKYKFTHMFLHGIQSTQKTAIACNILKEGFRQGLRGYFILAGDLIDALLKIQGFSSSTNVEEYIEKIKNSDVLVIDDSFDSSKSLLWAKQESKNIIITEWDRFLRKILSSNTKVIMTSNLSIEIVEQNYGRSMYELIQRNFTVLELREPVVTTKQNKYKKEI